MMPATRARRTAIVSVLLLLGGCPAPTETQVRATGPVVASPASSGNTAAERATDSLPAIAGAEGYALLPERIDVAEDGKAVDCIARAIAQAAPTARQLPFDKLRDGLFPWLEPGTKPYMEEDLLALLKRPLLQERLKSLDIRYVVHIGGRRLDQTARSYGGCSIGGCVDFTSQNVGAQLSATLLDLREGVALGGRDATSRGTSAGLLVGIVPIIFIAPTGSRVCSEVGNAIAKAFAAGEQR
ncbi:hypothetical protein [Desertibaculum subflavum]|uniref:hypothetical protein n=1 Tax=Desertibaculum subflavum TaxID=2268458 RepID=UPI000E669C8F